MKNLTKKYISERDSFILAFLAKFPATSSLAISLLQERQKGVFTEAGGLPTIKSTEQKLRQLSLLGVIQIHKNIYTPDRKNHYGITEYGFEVLKCNPKYSEITSYRTMEKLSVSRLNHYSKISEIASMFISPKDFYRSKLGTGFVELQQLVSENESRKAYSEISQQLQENRKSGAGIKSFSEWRKAELTKAFSEIKNRTLSLNEPHEKLSSIINIREYWRK